VSTNDRSGSAGPKAEPAVRTTLKPPRGRKAIVLTLSGMRLVTDDVAQDFATPAEAKRHFDGVLRARMKEGFTLGPVEIVADPPPAEEEEPQLDEPESEGEPVGGEFDEHRRWQLKFEGEQPPSLKACSTAIAKLREVAPSVVQILSDFASPGTAWAKALKGIELPSVKAFIFDTYYDTQSRQRENTIGDLRATLEACPSLERFFATGALVLSKGSHAQLRELYALGDPLSPKFLRALAGWKLPALERLVLSLASDAEAADDDEAIAVLTKLSAPKLQSVHVDSLTDVPRVLAELCSAGRTRSLKELQLSGGLDEDALLEVVERNLEPLRELEVLALPLEDLLSGDGIDRLRALCPSLRDLSELPKLTLPDAYDSWRGDVTPGS
jgi:hypothetical protein